MNWEENWNWNQPYLSSRLKTTNWRFLPEKLFPIRRFFRIILTWFWPLLWKRKQRNKLDFSTFEDEMNKTMESKLILNITNEILTNFNLDIRISNDQFLVRFYSIFRYLKFQMIIFFLLYFSVSPKVIEITIVFIQKSMVLSIIFWRCNNQVWSVITHQAWGDFQ